MPKYLVSMYASNKIELIGWHLPDDVDYIDLAEALSRIQTVFGHQEDELSNSTRLLEFLIDEKYCQAFIMVEFAPAMGKSKLPIHEAYQCPYWDKIEERMMGFSFDIEKNEVCSGNIEGKLKIPKLGFERGLAMFARYVMHTEKRNSSLISALAIDSRIIIIQEIIEEAIRRAAVQGQSLTIHKLPGTRNDLAEFLRKRSPKLFGRHDQNWMNARFKKLGIKFGRGQRVGSGTLWEELFPDDFLI